MLFRSANDTFYPPPGAYDTDYNAATNAQSPLAGNIANVLSTPVSYITVARIKDVFQDKNLNTALDEQYYTYQDLQYRSERAGASPFWLVVPTFYGPWRMVSVGPDKQFGHAGTIPTAQLAYDATNGTISAGNIFRSPNVNDSRQPDPGRAYANGTISAILLGAP